MQTATQNERRGKRARRSRTDWLEEVKRWCQSGQPAKVYARAHGLHPVTFACRASQLRTEAEALLAPKAGRASSAFVPVRLSNRSNERSGSLEPVGGGDFEVVLTNGRRVRFSGAYPLGTLGRVLAAVEGGASC